MHYQELVSVLQTTYDAGLLVNESAKVVYFNLAARELFSIMMVEEEEESFCEKNHLFHNNNNIEEILTFLDPQSGNPISWQKAKQQQQHSQDDESLSVIVINKNKNSTKKKNDNKHNNNNNTIFAKARFVVLDNVDKDNNYTLLFIATTTTQALVVTNSLLDASVLDPLFIVNKHGIIQTVNKAATLVFGYERDEFVKSNISMIIVKSDDDNEHYGLLSKKNHNDYDIMERSLLRTTTGDDDETRDGDGGDDGVIMEIITKRELTARRKDKSEFPIQLSLVEVNVNNNHHDNDDERLFCGYVHDLTEQKALLANIEREQNVVSGIIHASLDPLFQVDEKGIIQLVNDAATTQFGWTRDEFVGNNISMICGGNHASKHGEYMERYLRTGEARVMGTKRELPARRKDGSEFIIQLSLVEIPVTRRPGEKRIFCGFVLDLTEQKKHMHEIERRESFTNKIIEGSYDALLVTDKTGKIVRVNTTAVKKFEVGSDKLCSLSILSLLSPKDATWLEEEMQQYLTFGIPITAQREAEAVRPCGDVFPVSIGVSELEGPEGEPCFAIYMHDLTERKQMLKMEAEKAAAEYLLFNMLPETIAGKLKDDPSHIAESHSFAAVLFADIVGFTSMSSTMEPHEVVSMLNELFSLFDDVVEEYGLNKIKTIGDCYMTTSVPGIEGDETEHCRRMCHFGLDMIQTLQKYNLSEGRDRKLNLRVGINCGPVVAGVVGTKRFLYDLWGDAVNLASRMESTGVPGRVQAPAHVAELMKDDFEFERRGMVQVKGKGEMETYFLTGRKKEYVKAPPEKPKRRPRLNSAEDIGYIRESIRQFEASLLDIIDGPEYLDRVEEGGADDK